MAFRRDHRHDELLSALERVAGGDLSVRVTESGNGEPRRLAEAFNVMVEGLGAIDGQVTSASDGLSNSAVELASASEQLAATTVQQTSAATEISATMEELARASASIADHVNSVAEQAIETRSALSMVDEDIQASSERTFELNKRVNEIGSILGLINDIADKTDLLAVNASIEAARAGEMGRGFAVVADEVRRLAERSKTSAAQIAEIVESTQAETNATVMAMEKGSKQMRRGLELMNEVTEAANQVRLTTQQQREATGQVVETMEGVAETSRQTSSTSQDIAKAATGMADLAASLHRKESSATSTSGVAVTAAPDGIDPDAVAAFRARLAGADANGAPANGVGAGTHH